MLGGGAGAASAKPAASQSGPPKTARDYFLRLPQVYFEMPPAQRKAWLDGPGGLVDNAHDYVSFPGDGAQARMQMALFRYNGQVLVAVYLEAVDGLLDFLRYTHGHWRNVTRQVMPVAFSGDNVYELPRYGTRIRVTANKFNDETQERVSKTGRWLYDLVWRQGRLVVSRRRQ